jgi:hypothetical protein
MKNHRFRPYDASTLLLLLLLLHITGTPCSAESEGADFQLCLSGSGAGAASGEAGSSYAGANAGESGDVSGAGEPGAAGVSGSAESAGASGLSAGESAEAGAGGTDPCQPPAAMDTPVPEVCDNGLDDDLNGFVDAVRGGRLARLRGQHARTVAGLLPGGRQVPDPGPEFRGRGPRGGHALLLDRAACGAARRGQLRHQQGRKLLSARCNGLRAGELLKNWGNTSKK